MQRRPLISALLLGSCLFAAPALRAEVLTAGLPYSAAEIEAVLRGVAVRRSTRGRAK